MSMGTQISAAIVLSNRARVGKSMKQMVFRNIKWSAFWACMVVASIVAATYASNKLQLPAVVLFAYSVQAFLAEWIGVTVSLDRVSAPWRPASTWPVAVFWRTQGSPTDIEGLTSFSATQPNVVRLSWMRGGKIRLIFPTRDRKLEFFEAVRRFRPSVRVFREG